MDSNGNKQEIVEVGTSEERSETIQLKGLNGEGINKLLAEHGFVKGPKEEEPVKEIKIE